ncbi:MAG TPA: hypothetical protein VFZ08_01035 [Terriglobia bacterium]|nr:hypothetical protein [Terriglobia bacterium]
MGELTKRSLLVAGALICSLVCATAVFGQNRFHTVSSGAWSDQSIWFCFTCVNGPYIPNGSTGRATVFNANAVNLDISVTVQNLTINPGGSLSASGTSLTAGPDPQSSAAVFDAGSISLSNGASINDASGFVMPNNATNSVSLVVRSGSKLSDTFAAIGFPATGHSVRVLVTGQGSQWNTQGALYAGGTLVVRAGGLVTSHGGDIGSGAGGEGLVIITGSGSKWNNSGFLNIGDGGDGRLVVQNGGAVTSGVTIITTKPFAPGFSAVVDGMNSAWTVNGALKVGQGDSASLTILHHGAVTASGPLRVGGGSAANQANGVGGVTVETAGSLSSNGGTIDNAASASITSTVVVNGIGSKWTNSGELTVGNAGVGSMTVYDEGVVSTHSATLGEQSGSIGTVVINNGETKWINNGDLTVGENGLGILTIAHGSRVSSDTGTISAQSTSLGSTVTVIGNGALWDIGSDLTVGKAGSGNLNVEESGVVINAANSQTSQAILGDEAGSDAIVTVSGTNSRWTDGGDLTVGNSGVGSLTISAGGSVTDVAGDIGSQLDSLGRVFVGGSDRHGTGALWNNTAGLTVGDQGDGTLTIQYKAQVESADGTVGGEATGSGQVTINSAQWNIHGDLTVGDKGKGMLGILQGGKATDAAGDVGSELNSQGTVTVAGLWQNSADLTIGDSGSGTMTVNGSGSVTNTDGDIAANLGSTGRVAVQGNGSTSSIPTWYNNGSLKVGDGGTGELDVLDGGQVYSESGAVGGAQGSQGTVKVDGAGSQWTANNAPGGSGKIEIGTDAGTGKLAVSNGGTVKANEIEVGANGTLDGVNGTLISNITVDSGGTVSPGDPGPMKITGNFDLSSGSTLTLEVASATDYDSLNITGNGTFDGTIDLDFLNGFAPSAGDDFDFITASGAFAWNPSSINFMGLTPGTYTTDLAGGFGLTATSNWSNGGGGPSNGGGSGSPTPEPASALLLGTGLLALAALARRELSSRAG